MTRKAAITALIGMAAGLIVKVAESQTRASNLIVGDLADLSFGDIVSETKEEKQKNREAYEACQKNHSESVLCIDPDSGWLATSPTLVPGTARMKIHLDGWAGLEVDMGGKIVSISRQDIWEALQ